MRKTIELLGTLIELKLPFSSLFDPCFIELKRIENTYSRFDPKSYLNQVNQTLNKWQPITEEYHFLLTKAQEINRITHGLFDITLKKNLEDLGYGSKLTKQSFLAKIPFLKTISLKPKQVKLRKEVEIGGFGKGFALDQLAHLLDRKEVDRYYLNAGGDIVAKGDWEILLEHPDNAKKVFGKVVLNGAIASSSANRRQWKGGHHLLNPQTKQPINGIKAVFVKAETGLEADAYATALFAAGIDALTYMHDWPIEALIITNEHKVVKTKNFKVEFI